jgi:septal ring-binding cell division protein DamX
MKHGKISKTPLCLSLLALALTACNPWNTQTANSEYYYQLPTEEPIPMQSTNYSQNSDAPTNLHFTVPPRSYNFATTDSPVRHSERDYEWIKNQQSNNYTIQLGEAPDPTTVASTVQEIPKTGHTTTYRYQQNGQTVYGGTLGSYASQEEAQAALQQLPPEVQGTAKIQQWDHIKDKLAKPDTPPLSSLPSIPNNNKVE